MGCSSVVQCLLIMQWVVRSIPHGVAASDPQLDSAYKRSLAANQKE